MMSRESPVTPDTERTIETRPDGGGLGGAGAPRATDRSVRPETPEPTDGHEAAEPRDGQEASDPGEPQQAAGPPDDALDAWILARLDSLGVDLSVLPEDDEDAPADRRRILASARRFLRSTPPAIADFPFDPLGPPPAMYPSEMTGWTDE